MKQYLAHKYEAGEGTEKCIIMLVYLDIEQNTIASKPYKKDDQLI